MTAVIQSTSEDDTNGDTASSLTITEPTGTVEDDLLFSVLGSDDNRTTDVWTVPTGWTEDADYGDDTSDCKLGFAHIIRGASAPDLTFNHDSADELWAWTARITGHDSTTPIDVVGAENSEVSTSPTALSMTTNTDDVLAFACYAWDGGDSHPTTPPTDWSEEAERTSGTTSTDAGGAIASRVFPSAGATGDADFTVAGFIDGNVAAQIGIRAGPVVARIPMLALLGVGS